MNDIGDTQLFLPQIWASHARLRARQTAAICGARRVSWQDLNAAMNRIANALGARGIGRGDKVAVLMSNGIDTLEVMFGIVKAGACVVPLSLMLKPEQIASLIADSGACLVFASRAARTLTEAARVWPNAVRPDGFVATDFTGEGWVSFEAFRGDAGTAEPKIAYAMEDPFNIIYSSGTTGLPKGIVQSHRARLHWSYSNAIELGMNDRCIALATTSLYSNGTWFMLLPPMFLGGTMVIMEQFTPGAFLELVEREEASHSFVVPTQCIMILQDELCGRRNLTSLKALLSAGSALRSDVRAEVERRISPNLYELYGFSEGFATMIKPGQSAEHPGSVGRPVAGFDIRIVDDEGNDLPVGEIGEIAGYGAGLMNGYHNRPAETAAAIARDPLGRPFVRGGDLGRLDADGFLYILDRKKDMIISGGFNIYPADIEEIVGRHEAVLDVTVIGVPHPKWDETPLALVIPRPGAAVVETEILAWANERLAKTQRLSGVELRSEFPRNALGKVLKRFLREPYWSAGK